ncbi:hypothetical protein [Pseudorhodoferax sp. Leaf267]|uniref:hypothetical protein n=1 Tax=Pseudorhodoferax sp. Leaf267 TaxID=1736316 RepID=UPI0006FC1191|nr:hypothetical protein [Pseudorhodoferax sp. Leaf267]KQP23445.1 hypothetical protein ASF43_06195 [Pseudorhodoferax sp. Leaf267]
MRVSEAASAEKSQVGSMREGVLELKILLTGEDDSPSNYCMQMNRTGSGGWSTPRHRHNFDQVRYILKGTYPYAKGKSMPEGWVGYFPEGVRYGPQDRPEGLEMLTLQFGGASGNGFLSVARRERANRALQSKGVFKDGIFSYVDANGKLHNQDGSEACFEEATGQKLSFGSPRYQDLVLMDPASFQWIEDPVAGVFHKWLGTFTERRTQIGLTRVEPGASFVAGGQPSIELLFLSRGSVEIGGKTYGPHSAFELAAHHEPVAIRGVTPAEFLRLVLPQF